MPNPARFVWLGLLLLGSLPAAQEPWAQLKVGMGAADTAALLGHPIFHRQGHGFTTWTYDRGGEVLLHANGTVIGWTAPKTARVAVRSRDIWSNRPDGEFSPTMHSVLPRPMKAGIKSRAAGVSRGAGSPGDENLIRG
jgi:hypothetical protein